MNEYNNNNNNNNNKYLTSTEEYKSLNMEKRTGTWNWGKWRYATSRNDRKTEEGIHQKIKNETEVQVE